MSDVFTALANPVRRSLLELLADGPQSVNELASHFDMKRPSVSEHLALLKQTGLVQERRSGRHRVYRLEPEPLRDVASWLAPFEHFWHERLAALAELLDEETR
jgi:DNA-binding transcriptional ArsR family regulator